MQNNFDFGAFGLDPRLNRGVASAGYEEPTPIQKLTIPEAMEGRHVLGLAQTGTGKTAAFALPILDKLVTPVGEQGQRHRGRGARRKVRALIIAPTRELAEQINTEFRTLSGESGLRSATVYGGVGYQPQIEALRGRADIIVACPGRLLDLMERGDADLSNVETLVLDEADHMFDMGFLPPIRRILASVPQDAQRMLFSATMPSEVAHLADEVLTDPHKVEIGHSAPAETIDHALIAVDEGAKAALLLHMLKTEDHRSTLVFTRTKHRAKRLARRLDEANIFVADLQGNLSQRRRQQALDGFKSGKYHVLVATDIAARGIDVARVSHVINYDFPDTPEAYTHRIGRTGRAQRSGKALTFVTADDFRNVQQLERRLGMRIERERVEGFAGPHEELEQLRPTSSGRRQGQGSRQPGSRGRGSGGRSRGGRPNRSGAQRSRGAGQQTAGGGGSNSGGSPQRSNNQNRGRRSGRRPNSGTPKHAD